MDFDPIANIILRAQAHTLTAASDHMTRFDVPMNGAAKTYMMRSVVQAQMINGEAPEFKLNKWYLDAGRVEIAEESTGQRFILKSRLAVRFEPGYQDNLFDGSIDPAPGYAPLSLLLYSFGPGDLRLSTVRVELVRRQGRRRYQLLDAASPVGVWPYDGPAGRNLFDQGAEDEFTDLSDGVRIVGELGS